jgi:hypothetical protein
MKQSGIEVRRDMTAMVLRKKARGEKDRKVASRYSVLDLLEPPWIKAR